MNQQEAEQAIEYINTKTTEIVDRFKAIHEAAHAVVACSMGWETVAIKLLSDSGDGELGGYCKNDVPEDEDPDDIKNFTTFIIVSYAGNQAQRYFYKKVIEPMERDPGGDDAAAELRLMVLSGDGMDRAGRNEILQGVPLELRPSLKRRLRKASRNLVEFYFPLIYNVADLLLKHDEGLDASGLSKIVGEYTANMIQ